MQQLVERRVEKNESALSRRVDSPNYDAAFDDAYSTFYSRVFDFIYNRVENRDLAEDLTSAVFEKAYPRLGRQLTNGDRAPAWLFRAARSVVNRHRRRPSRREMSGIEEWVNEPAGDDGERDDLIDTVIQSDRLDRFRVQLRALPRREQDLLSLRFVAQLPFAQIAETLGGMTERDARLGTYRATRRLREAIEAEEM